MKGGVDAGSGNPGRRPRVPAALVILMLVVSKILLINLVLKLTT